MTYLAKMVSAELVRRYRICFDETVAANDAMFAAYVDYHARKVAACSGMFIVSQSEKIHCSMECGQTLFLPV